MFWRTDDLESYWQHSLLEFFGGVPCETRKNAHVDDRPTFPTIFRQYGAFVWRTLRYLGVLEADLPDQCQEVFLVVLRRLPDFEDRSSLRTWIYGIALRVASDYRKRAHRRFESVGRDVSVEGGETHEGTLEARRELLEALDGLDETRRVAFVLHAVEGLTFKEMAEILGCSVQLAHVRYGEARTRLEAALSEESMPSLGELLAVTP